MVPLDCEPQGAVDADIMGFLSRSLCGIPYCAEIVRDLTKKAGGLFVYAKFAVDLFRNNPDLVDENLQKLQENSDAHALDKLYLTILHNAFPKCVLDSGTNRNHVQKVLAGTVLLQDRCSVHTLASLITVGAQHVREILLQLNPVIHFDRSDPDSTVYPLHVSFSDFILSSERCGDRNFYIDAQVYHRLFATRCLSIMNQWEALCRNPLSLSNPSVFKNSIEDLPTRVKGYIPAVTQYACLHWATHLCASHRTQKDDPQLRGLLRTFCSEKLLVWLEALSFMDRLDIAPTALKNAHGTVRRITQRPHLVIQRRSHTLG
ncbi:hypothetical protein A0H81_12091 [Grifola frondosa]|uniref:Uncharacterized protein n=1 Tax=Grifola frondosa TaxID=5627 RepID=A0A1C7LSR4_GRIFR|nr:hypothetical protein A0H81_12091 [Grifola frondosa]